MNLIAMWMARIVCSHGDCTEEQEVVVDSLDELDRLSCECGWAFVTMTISEVELV